MINVCELQCKGISHVSVNADFIYGLRLAYPNEPIFFYSDTAHYREICSLFEDRGISIKDLIHVPIHFNASRMYSLFGLIHYFLRIKFIFNQLLANHNEKILFLSTSPIILFLIKVLKQLPKYRSIRCTCVLHGEFEDIANEVYINPYVPTIPVSSVTQSLNMRSLISKASKNMDKIPLFLYEKLMIPFSIIGNRYSRIYKKYFRTKKMMLWRHSEQFHYISLSPHVTKNAKKYLDIRYMNIFTIYLPIIFKEPTKVTHNKSLICAVYGYGDSLQMHKMLSMLSQKNLRKPYLIKIISMDSRGTEGFHNVKTYSQGKVLSRNMMEDAAEDVDIFLNLYDYSRHSLGCSLSIFEAFSHCKPVLHLSNPGYNYFNMTRKPIGYKANSLKEFVELLYKMIENYHEYKKYFSVFEQNILDYRKQYAIENNIDILRASLNYI